MGFPIGKQYFPVFVLCAPCKLAPGTMYLGIFYPILLKLISMTSSLVFNSIYDSVGSSKKNTKISRRQQMHKNLKISIGEICKELDISATTLYRYLNVNKKEVMAKNENALGT